MITAESLVLRYGKRAPAVRDVSFEVPRGKLTALVGPNGSGKSSIVRAVLRRITPVQGRIRVDGRAIESMRRDELARIVSVIPQREEPAFPLPVRDYVALGRLPFHSAWRGTRPDDAGVVESSMRRAGVSELAARFTDELSGGEWQRARIARALAQDGEALILDEPTTFLDVAHEMAVFELARELALEGRAVLVVSHQINLVARFADVMVLLNNGALIASGSPHEVMRGDLLESVYGWPLVVTRDPAVGAPALVPLRKT